MPAQMREMVNNDISQLINHSKAILTYTNSEGRTQLSFEVATKTKTVMKPAYNKTKYRGCQKKYFFQIKNQKFSETLHRIVLEKM